MNRLIPHVFGLVHRLELQLTQIDRFRRIRASIGSIPEGLPQQISQLSRAVRFIRRQAILMQLARAKGSEVDAHRHIQHVYAMLELLRPELQSVSRALHLEGDEPAESPRRRVNARHATMH